MKNFNSGTWTSRQDYKSFEPEKINRSWIFDNPAIQAALSKADRQIGRLDMFSNYVPDLDLFVLMHVSKEAAKSSKIEGTQTEVQELFLPEEEVQLERRDDWQEVQNYITAMNASVKNLNKLPYSNRLLKEAHHTLMQGVRGDGKTPGEYRRSQNWIGGSNPSNARFVPPHQDGIQDLMGDLELFAHNEELFVPPLIKAGLLHYQFETIHPFLDGNGRIGRLMIPIYLISENIIQKPVLYLSEYFEKNRDEYYDRLTQARLKNDIAGWLLFFLDGVTETAGNGAQTFDQILKFQRHWEAEINNWKPQSASNLALFRHLFTQPVVNAGQVADALGIAAPSAYRIVKKFVKAGLLTEITGAKRGKLYAFKAYLDLF